MDLQEYQHEIANRLRVVYPNTPIETEWRTMTGVANVYSPRLDAAVGPFAVNQRYIEDYNQMVHESWDFLELLLNFHNMNMQMFGNHNAQINLHDVAFFNENSRCFLAIEIENNVSRKHLMGGAINASALGRIGLAVAWTDEKLRAFVKLNHYLSFLTRVEKNTFNTRNLLVLHQDQFIDALD
ncbi:hypothetical protein [Pelobacter seleniigenes]|uniref:hypothetical protein n=1 Tax=Pelobacter seleniigenes TaxID=407188 RepID=UPI0004A6C95E|nr:hypothetical protein [Pelobacter seleniigenes]